MVERNPLTGELEETVKRITRTTSMEQFMCVYLEDLTPLFSPKLVTNRFKVLLHLWKIAHLDTNEVYLLKSDKEAIVEDLGLKSVNYLNKVVYELVALDMLIRIDPGKYMLNPTHFFKGSTIKRNESLSRIIKYRIA